MPTVNANGQISEQRLGIKTPFRSTPQRGPIPLRPILSRTAFQHSLEVSFVRFLRCVSIAIYMTVEIRVQHYRTVLIGVV